VVVTVVAGTIGGGGRRGAEWYPMRAEGPLRARPRVRAGTTEAGSGQVPGLLGRCHLPPGRRQPPDAGPRATLPAVTASSEVPSSFRSSSIRPGSLALIRIGISETLSRRRLIAYLIRADLKKSGADTLLGNLWWVLDPLLQMMVYYVLVGIILERGKGTPDYPLFIFAAILPWKWFTETVQGGVGSVVSGERLIKQIYFPKLVLPLASAFSSLVSFGFGLIPLIALMVLAYPDRLTAWILLIPVIAVVQAVFSLSISITVSALNVFYRDVGNIAGHILRFWFYLSPTLYSVEDVHKIAKGNTLIIRWYELNPFTHILGSYRSVVYYGTAPDWIGLGAVFLTSVVLLGLAILVFKRAEPSFAKVL
jgi:lipopolysaccharide transport system permease protein/teichoic acid transport system permease protein